MRFSRFCVLQTVLSAAAIIKANKELEDKREEERRERERQNAEDMVAKMHEEPSVPPPRETPANPAKPPNPDANPPNPDANPPEKIAEDDAQNAADDDPENKDIVTRSKTGSLTPRTFNIEDLRKRTTAVLNRDDPDGRRAADESLRMTRLKSTQIANGTYLYKLGMEGNFRAYVNQFATNVIALNKPQRNEERDKKRHLSHKFSLTTASEFKWIGGEFGRVECWKFWLNYW